MNVWEFDVGEPVDGEDPISIELTFERIVCARHGEPFRSGWPGGFPTFSVMMFDQLAHDEAFSEVVGRKTSLVHEALDRSPICERVDKIALLGAYIASDIGVERICDGCGVLGLGTKYLTRTGPTVVHEYQHLCFNCVVFNLKPMS